MRAGLRVLLVITSVAAWASAAPRWIAGRGADALFDGDAEAQGALAREVAAYVASDGAAKALHTGSSRFDGEWTLVTYQMAALGLGQIALAHPELRAAHLPSIEASVARLLEPDATAFGAEAWGERGLDHPESDRGHAYLGYVNLALGMLRLLDPTTRLAPDHDRLTDALARRIAASPTGLIETYPGESYPADVSAVLGSIGLYDRATSSDHRALLDRAALALRARFVDAGSGLFTQAADATTGRPLSEPRASGTAISVYFLSFASPSGGAAAALSSDLFEALRRSQRAAFVGFGGVAEYPPGVGGSGDIDSGPVLLGVSISATGFALAGARMYGDRPLFTELYRTARLFGVPVDRGEGRRFMSGGALGNAILLAMMTALPPEDRGLEHRAVVQRGY